MIFTFREQEDFLWNVCHEAMKDRHGDNYFANPFIEGKYSKKRIDIELLKDVSEDTLQKPELITSQEAFKIIHDNFPEIDRFVKEIINSYLSEINKVQPNIMTQLWNLYRNSNTNGMNPDFIRLLPVYSKVIETNIGTYTPKESVKPKIVKITDKEGIFGPVGLYNVSYGDGLNFFITQRISMYDLRNENFNGKQVLTDILNNLK